MTASTAAWSVTWALLFYCSIIHAAVTDENSLATAVAAGGSVKINVRQIKLSRPISVTQDTIVEARHARTVLSGEHAVRIFEVASNVNLTLVGLTLANGRNTNGGAIYNDGGSVTIIDCRFLNNVAQGSEAAAGARGTNGTTNSLAWRPGDGGNGNPGEVARGGAIFNRGQLHIWSSLFQSNAAVASAGGAGGAGGAVWQSGAPGAGGNGGNGANAEGGAIYSDGTAEFFSTHFIGNGARSSTGGIGGPPGTNTIRIYSIRTSGESGSSGSARGGAVFARGTMRSSDSTFDSNYLVGADGKNGVSGGAGYGEATYTGAAGRLGQSGGDALGGAIFVQGHTVMERTSCRQNFTVAGKGGNGGNGGNGSGSYYARGGDGGRAGTGGVAEGGAVAVFGYLTVVESKLLQNSVSSGAGGNGGSGGSSAAGSAWPPRGVDGASAGIAAGGGIFQAGDTVTITASEIISNIVNSGAGGAGGQSGWSPNPATPSGESGDAADSGNGFGGGISAFGAVRIERTQIGFNAVVSAPGPSGVIGIGGSKIGRSGRSGARGGTAVGGGAWFGGSAELRESSVIFNRVAGGNGGNGGDGSWGLYTASYGGRGGGGGDAFGGGVFSDANLTAENCTVAQNSAQSGSGGIGAVGDSFGGLPGHDWHEIQSTGSGGSGGAASSGIFLSSNAVAQLSFSTIASNTILLGLGGTGPTNIDNSNDFIGNDGVNLGASLHADNSATLLACVIAGRSYVNCSGNIIDGGFNLCSDASGGFTNTTSHINIDPLLLPLASNGGPTLTMGLAAGSAARDAAFADSCPSTDQRGYLRPTGGPCDIGALEVDAAPESAASEIVGRITDTVNGIAGVRVRIGMRSVTTDGFGTYRLNGLRPGKYLVRPAVPDRRFEPQFHRLRIVGKMTAPDFVARP